MRTRIAISRFWVADRSFWQETTMPVGMCVSLIADSVFWTCWPPAPDDRNVSVRISSQLSSISTSSSASGMTSIRAKVV